MAKIKYFLLAISTIVSFGTWVPAHARPKAPAKAQTHSQAQCLLAISDSSSDWLGSSLNKLFNLGVHSESIEKKELRFLRSKGFVTIQRPITYTDQGLSDLKEGLEFALFKKENQYSFYFNIKSSDENKVLKVTYPKDNLPNCEKLKSYVKNYKIMRHYLLEAKKYKDISWGKSFMALEAAEKAKYGQLISIDQWQRLLKNYDWFTSEMNKNLLKGESPLEKLELLRQKLLDLGLSSYKRDLTTLIEILDGPGGNCVARSVAFTALIRDLKIELPKGYSLGVEVFRDHIQAVLVNKGQNHSIDLLTSKPSSPLTNPIYSAEWFFKMAFNKNSAYFLKVDNFTVGTINTQPDLFKPKNLKFQGIDIDSGSIKDSKKRVNRIDVFEFSNFASVSLYNTSGQEVPESLNEAFLNETQYSLTNALNKHHDQSLRDGKNREFFGKNHSQNHLEFLKKPYFTVEQINNSDLSLLDKLAYKAMLERGYFTKSDIEKYGFNSFAKFFPNGLSEYHMKSVVPPYKISRKKIEKFSDILRTPFISGSLTSSIDFEPAHEEKITSKEEFSNELIKKSLQKYFTRLRRSILAVRKSIDQLEDESSIINLEKAHSIIFDLFTITEHYRNSDSIFGRWSIFYGTDVKGVLEHNGFDINKNEFISLVKKVDSFAERLIEKIYQSPHELILSLNKKNNQEIALWFKTAATLYDLAYEIQGMYSFFGEPLEFKSARRTTDTLWRALGNFGTYLIQNKKYFYSDNDLSHLQEIALKNNPVLKILYKKNKLPTIELPKVRARNGICNSPNSNGYAREGVLLFNCQNQNQNLVLGPEAFYFRNKVSLNPYLFLNILALPNVTRNPANLILAAMMWTDSHSNALNFNLQHEDEAVKFQAKSLEFQLSLTSVIIEAPYLSFTDEEIGQSKACWTSENRTSCILQIIANKLNAHQNISMPYWVSENLHLKIAYEEFLKNPTSKFTSSFKTFHVGLGIENNGLVSLVNRTAPEDYFEYLKNKANNTGLTNIGENWVIKNCTKNKDVSTLPFRFFYIRERPYFAEMLPYVKDHLSEKSCENTDSMKIVLTPYTSIRGIYSAFTNEWYKFGTTEKAFFKKFIF